MTGVGSASFWQRDVSLPAWPTLDQAPVAAVEVLVVGAGLAGCSVARELSALGTRGVLVVDALGPGAGASGRNAGFVMLGNALDYPEQVRTRGREQAKLLIELGRRNQAAIRDGFGDRCEYRASGSLMLAEAEDARALSTLEHAATLLTQDGVRVELEPAPDGLVGFGRALIVHEDATVHPGKLLAALSEGIEGRRGVVEALDDAAGVARIDGREIRFDRVVTCANGFSPAFVPELESWLTLQRAQISLTEPVRPWLDRPCYAGWGYDYFRQLGDGSVLLGGRRNLFFADEQTPVAEPSDAVQRALDEYRTIHMPIARDAKVRQRWAGIMGFSRDGLPLLGPVPGRSRTHVLAGFTGHGLGMALACGPLVARALVDRLEPDDVALVRMLDSGRIGAAA